MTDFLRHVALGALWLAGLIASSASHGQFLTHTTRCWLEGSQRVLPSRQQCLLSVTSAEGLSTVEELLARARRSTNSSQFDDAGHALDCVESLIAVEGSATQRHALVRQRGVLAYRQERLPQALSHFECALSLSRSEEHGELLAQDLNAVGSALRRLGDYHGALGHLSESLQHARSAGTRTAAMLNNIGDVYRDLDELDESLRHYREAEQQYLAQGDPIHAAHVQESMAVVALSQGKAGDALVVLQQALHAYDEAGQYDYVLRVHGWLIRAALARGEIEDAARWRTAGEAIAEAHRLLLPLPFVLQAARAERLSGAVVSAEHRLQKALAQNQQGSDAERAELFTELAATQEMQNNWSGALASLRQAGNEARVSAEARHDRALGWLRTRFEISERDRTISALEADNHLRQAAQRQQALLFGVLTLTALALLLIGGLVLQRRRQREREQQAVALARKEEELARYRREAADLGEDRAHVQSLLDSRIDALVLLDADGLVMAANRAACGVLVDSSETPTGRAIAELAHIEDRETLRNALERMEDSSAEPFPARFLDAAQHLVRLSAWPEGNGLVVMELLDQATAENRPAEATSSDDEAVDGDSDSGNEDARREVFRRLLVELMLATLDAWERSTQRNRLDLAEASRIWRVAIDDGRLRARSMERYLNIGRLPQHPRWRDVLRTTYYVLENCPLDSGSREALQSQVDSVLAYTRRRALV